SLLVLAGSPGPRPPAARGTAARAVTATVPAPRFEKCELSASGDPRHVDAECTTVTVPEDRARPRGAQIHLHVAVVRARAKPRERAADPVSLLAGGPGQAASEAYVLLEGAFEWVLRRRDVVLLDQRGTGQSNALTCDSEPKAATPASM